MPQRESRTQGTHRGSRIAQVKAGEILAVFQQNRLGVNRSSATFDDGLGKVFGHFHMNAQRFQGLAHVAGVVAFQKVM